MDKGGRLRLGVAVVLAAVGAALLLMTRSPTSGTPFNGSVAVVPGQAGVEASVVVSFEPADPTNPEPGQAGNLSISLSNDRAQDDAQTRWYVFLAGDAMLDDARVLNFPGDSSRAIQGLEFRPPWSSGEPSSYQVFEVTGSDQVRLVGTPSRSPVGGDSRDVTVEMPKVLTSQPTERTRRSGGLILVEEPALALLLANPHLVSPTAGGSWNFPINSRFRVESGFSESGRIRVEQAVPDLNRNKWGSLITWESDHPFAASATLLNSQAAKRSDLLSAVGFLLLGAALPLLVEVGLSRRPSPPDGAEAHLTGSGTDSVVAQSEATDVGDNADTEEGPQKAVSGGQVVRQPTLMTQRGRSKPKKSRAKRRRRR